MSAQAQLEQTARSLTKQQQREAFAHDPIDLRCLPRPDLVSKARRILQALQQHSNYTLFKGKRLRHDRTLISIPINHDYRMLLRDCRGRLEPMKVMSHEDYNVKRPGI